MVESDGEMAVQEQEREKGQITRHDIILNFITDGNIMFTKLIADSDSDNKILQDNISFNGTYLKVRNSVFFR